MTSKAAKRPVQNVQKSTRMLSSQMVDLMKMTQLDIDLHRLYVDIGAT